MLSDLLQLGETGPAVAAPLMVSAAVWGWVFLSVMARLLGLLVLSPVFANAGVPIWMRVGLAACLAMVVTPVLVSSGTFAIPMTGWTAIISLVGEWVIGALLGCGVLFLFAGLKLAGELIDQQAGSAVQEVFDPHGSGSTTATSQLLTIIGTLALLTITPGNGHLLIVDTLLDSFVTLSSASIGSGNGMVAFLCHLGQSSLSLGLQMAAPVLAAGAITSWGLATLSGGSNGSPYATTLLGLPVRIVVSLGILTMCLSGMTEAFLASFNEVLLQFPILTQVPILTRGA